MTVARYFLGYDLRACAKDYVSTEWAATRRLTYLLKHDIPWPLSVDTTVWPSLFHFTSRRGDYRPVETVEVEPANQEQLVLRLWDDRAVMEATFHQKAVQQTCFVPVAIELLDDRSAAEKSEWKLITQALSRQSEPPRGWTSVGYDVADADYVSGLTNCGYAEDERTELSDSIKALNEFGLFGDFERAAEFRSISEKRVPEHAPFFVYRLLVDLNEGIRRRAVPARSA